jgi:hypothetical protein
MESFLGIGGFCVAFRKTLYYDVFSIGKDFILKSG